MDMGAIFFTGGFPVPSFFVLFVHFFVAEITESGNPRILIIRIRANIGVIKTYM